MNGKPGTCLKVTHLTHDLGKRQSLVNFAWDDDSGRRLGLTVPFGTRLEDVQAEAEKAVRALAAELAAISVVPG